MAGELRVALDNNTKKRMPPELLKSRISKLFEKVRMCTLCTTNGRLPRATPLEFFVDDMDMYIGTLGGTKSRNLKVNGNVSVSVSNAVKVNWEKSWDKVWGMQITGYGEIFECGSPEWKLGRDVIDYGSFMRALGMSGSSITNESHVLKVSISRIELFDYSMLKRGYTYRQVWKPASNHACRP
jgi:hypothetical protein